MAFHCNSIECMYNLPNNKDFNWNILLICHSVPTCDFSTEMSYIQNSYSRMCELYEHEYVHLHNAAGLAQFQVFY